MTSILYSLANATTRLKKSRSTTWVVGLWGKERIIIFGFGHSILIALSARSMKSPPAREGDRPDVRAGDHHRVGMDRICRVGYERDVPGAHRRQHEVGQPLLRADRGDRLVSGSSSTLYLRLYQLQMASRSFGIPRESE